MIVLGIDPGTATIGYALATGTKLKPEVLAFGVIKTSSKMAMNLRLAEIGQDLGEIINQFKPDKAVIESLFFFKNQKTVITVAQARGVLMYVTSCAAMELVELTPLQIKQAITGYGRAPKAQMQKVVQKIFNLSELPRPDDAADALGIAWCGLN